MVIELRVVQFWSEIILVISNRTQVNCLRLQRVLRGTKRTQGDVSLLRLPVTDDILADIFKASDLNTPDHCMFGQHEI